MLAGPRQVPALVQHWRTTSRVVQQIPGFLLHKKARHGETGRAVMGWDAPSNVEVQSLS